MKIKKLICRKCRIETEHFLVSIHRSKGEIWECSNCNHKSQRKIKSKSGEKIK